MERYVNPVTPAEISTGLQGLIDRLVPGGEPAYVEAVPHHCAPENECFPIVEEYVRTQGGDIVFGWSLWEFPTLFAEAEFHSVWRNPTGALLDVAPKGRQTKRILFLVDPARRYEGRQVNNVRAPLRRDPVVQEFLSAHDAHFEIMNRGERANQHEIALADDELVEYRRVLERMQRASRAMMPMNPLVGAYGPCLCGSGKKVRWCCGQAT